MADANDPGTPGQGTPAPGVGNAADDHDDATGGTAGEPDINRAITKRLKKSEERFNQRLAENNASLLASFKEMLAASVPKPAANDTPQTDPNKVKDGGKPADPPAQRDPTLAALEQEVASLKKLAATAKAEAEAERAKARDALLRDRVRTTLEAAGVTGVSTKAAMAMLVDSEKRVAFDDDGKLVFRSNDPDEDPVDLVTGIKSWTKTDDGKHFLPPRGATGSGDRPGGKPPTQTPAVPQRGDIGRAVLALSEGLSTTE